MLAVKTQTKRLADLNYLVVGLGTTGASVARFLLGGGYRCRVQDTRELPPGLGQLRADCGDFEFHAGPLPADWISWAEVVVISPGLPVRDPVIQDAMARGKTVIGDIELFARMVDAPVIAITGSNGKSTVTTLVGNMFACAGRAVAVGGNLGTPALDLLDEGADSYVLELSSYQLETTDSLAPQVAAILNLSEDHLDRYPSYDDYIAAKHRIYPRAEIRVSNADDAATRCDVLDVRFSLDPASGAEFHLLEDNGSRLARAGEAWLDTGELKLRGRHNWANCLAAMAIASSAGIPREPIVAALRAFEGIAHRSQYVAEVDGVEYINDSKATNVGAALASIEGSERPVILIAGGQSKGADMTVMREALARKVRCALLLGEDAPILAQAWQGATEIESVADMAAAVTRARELARPGDCVMLAPACASFDMYPKFEARGDDFIARVREFADV